MRPDNAGRPILDGILRYWQCICILRAPEVDMYAQVRKYHSIRGGQTTEQVCRDIERTGLSRFDQIPGFVDYLVLELNDGGLLTVSIYEDRAGVEAAKEASAHWNTTEAARALPERPDEAFEGRVRIHHPAAKTAAGAR